MKVQSLIWEGPLEEEMATHSSILAWRIPWTESLAGYSPWGYQKSQTQLSGKRKTTFKIVKLIQEEGEWCWPGAEGRRKRRDDGQKVQSFSYRE